MYKGTVEQYVAKLGRRGALDDPQLVNLRVESEWNTWLKEKLPNLNFLH